MSSAVSHAIKIHGNNIKLFVSSCNLLSFTLHYVLGIYPCLSRTRPLLPANVALHSVNIPELIRLSIDGHLGCFPLLLLLFQFILLILFCNYEQYLDFP